MSIKFVPVAEIVATLAIQFAVDQKFHNKNEMKQGEIDYDE